MAVERVGAGGLFVGRAAQEGKGPSDGAARMIQHSQEWGQPWGDSHSDGSLSSVGAAKVPSLFYGVGRNPSTLPALGVMNPSPFHLSRNKNSKLQGPSRLYLSLLGVCMVLCPLGRG